MSEELKQAQARYENSKSQAEGWANIAAKDLTALLWIGDSLKRKVTVADAEGCSR